MNCLEKYKKYKNKLKKSKRNNVYNSKCKYYKTMIGGMRTIDKKYLQTLDQLIIDINSQRSEHDKIDESHGLHHGMIVLCNVSKALDVVESGFMTDRDKLLVKLASLLHDIDDHKYFPDNHKFENARQILNSREIREIDNLTDNEISSVLLMIYLVSSSTHGDTMPVGLPEWYFYPRYADRLEALGIIGLERTFEYTVKKKQPLFLTNTSRAHNEQELFESIATIERYKNYSLPGSKSESMMDHFYDKLLRLGTYPISNRYFDSETRDRIKPLVDFCLEFSEKFPDGELLTNERVNTDVLDIFTKFVHDFIKKCPEHLIKSRCANQADEYITEVTSH